MATTAPATSASPPAPVAASSRWSNTLKRLKGLGDAAHLDDVKAKIALRQKSATDPSGWGFQRFEQSNSVDTPGYRVLRETRFVPLWNKAGLPP